MDRSAVVRCERDEDDMTLRHAVFVGEEEVASWPHDIEGGAKEAKERAAALAEQWNRGLNPMEWVADYGNGEYLRLSISLRTVTPADVEQIKTWLRLAADSLEAMVAPTEGEGGEDG